MDLNSLRLLWRVPLLLLHIVIGIPLVLVTFLPGLRNLPIGEMRREPQAHDISTVVAPLGGKGGKLSPVFNS